MCYQPRRGYRYGVDAYALAAFALRFAPTSALDLGAGSGIVALLLASKGVCVTAVERDARWVPMLDRSISESQLSISVIWGDVRLHPLPSVDLVVANPPWFAPHAGPLSPDDFRAHARTALHGDVETFVNAGLRAAPLVLTVGPDVPPLWAPAYGAQHGGLRLRAYSKAPRPTETVDLGDVYAPFRVVPG